MSESPVRAVRKVGGGRVKVTYLIGKMEIEHDDKMSFAGT
jgi:hypothetical protein